MFRDLQSLWPFSLTKPDLLRSRSSSGHVLSKTKSVTPHSFYISDITNSLSFNGKNFRKKSMLENFRANALKAYFLLFSNACRSDSKSPISPTTVAGAVTYLATASICESDDSCFWNPFFSLFAFFQLENQFFVKAKSALDEVSIPLWSAFKQYGNKQRLLWSLVIMQPLKSFKPCCLKYSCWILTLEGLCRDSKFFGWYGLTDTFTKTWSGGLSCLFVASCLPAIVVDGFKSFSFLSCSLINSDCFFEYTRLWVTSAWFYPR